MRLIRAFFTDRAGVTAIEYTIMAAGIALAVVLAVSLTGDEVNVLFTDMANAVQQN